MIEQAVLPALTSRNFGVVDMHSGPSGQDSDRGRGRGAPIKPGLATEKWPGPGRGGRTFRFAGAGGSIANSSHMLRHKLDDNLYYFRNITLQDFLRRPKFWRSKNMPKLNKNPHISDVTENKGIFHHFVF